MPTISVIRRALKERLLTIPTLNVYDVVPGQINPPAAVLRRRRGPRPATGGSTAHDYTFVVTIFTSLADDRAAQDRLADFLSPDGKTSIHAALEADNELGGAVDYAMVVDVEDDKIIEFAGIAYIGADVIVDVGA